MTKKHLRRFNYELFCTVGNRESTVLICLTTHLLASKSETRCEFPLLSQCQPGLSPPPAETQQQVSQEILTKCKAGTGTKMHPVTHMKHTHTYTQKSMRCTCCVCVSLQLSFDNKSSQCNFSILCLLNSEEAAYIRWADS